jgi:aryl carrier-like protein
VLRLDAETIAGDADFFALGGDSLRAALLVSRLRRQPGGAGFTVRDVYEARTPRAMAQVLRERGERAAAEAGSPRPAATVLRSEGLARPWLATGVQVLFLVALLLAVSSAAYVLASSWRRPCSRPSRWSSCCCSGHGCCHSASSPTRWSPCGSR